MPPFCEFALIVLFKLEKKDPELSFGLAGPFSSGVDASSPLVAGGVLGALLPVGAGPGDNLSDVTEGENLELKLFIHDARFEPLSEPLRSRPNRL